MGGVEMNEAQLKRSVWSIRHKSGYYVKDGETHDAYNVFHVVGAHNLPKALVGAEDPTIKFAGYCQ